MRIANGCLTECELVVSDYDVEVCCPAVSGKICHDCGTTIIHDSISVYRGLPNKSVAGACLRSLQLYNNQANLRIHSDSVTQAKPPLYQSVAVERSSLPHLFVCG